MRVDSIQKDCFAFTLMAIVLAVLAVLLAGCGGKALNKPFGSDYAGPVPQLPPVPQGTTQEGRASFVAPPPRAFQTNSLPMSYPPGFVATGLEQTSSLTSPSWQAVAYTLAGEDWEVMATGQHGFYRVKGYLP
jgi:hypothetical protein